MEDEDILQVDVTVAEEKHNLEYQLEHKITPQQCSYKIIPSKIEIILKKMDKLEGDPNEQVSREIPQTSATKLSDGPPSYPTSKEGKGWSAIERDMKRQEAKEKAEGEEAVKKPLLDIYGNGSDEVKKAMTKSYFESGGTVLSTNWDEIKKEKVPVKPPDEMEWKKFQGIIKEKKKKKKDKMQLHSLHHSSNSEENHKHDEMNADCKELKSTKAKKTDLNDSGCDSKQMNEEKLVKQHDESATESKIEDNTSESKKRKSKKNKLKNYIIEESVITITDKTVKDHSDIKIQTNDGKTDLDDSGCDLKQVNEEKLVKQYDESATESKIEDNTSESKKKKSKKNKLKNYIIEESVIMITDKTVKDHSDIKIQTNDGKKICGNLPINDETDSRKKQRKSRKKKVEDNDSNGVSNPAYSDFSDRSSFDSHDIREENEETINEQVNGRNCEETLIEELGNTGHKRKKRKQGNEEKVGISNPTFNDFNDNLPNENLSLQEALDEDEKSTPRRKKKQRKSEGISNEGIDNPTFGISVSDRDTSVISGTSANSYEIKSKKKKKKKNGNEEIRLDNHPVDTDPNNYDDPISSLNPSELTNQKKKIPNEETGLDNSALNLNDSIPDTDLVLNVVNRSVILKKNVEKVDSNSSKERVRGVKRKSVRFSNILQERIIPNDPSERINEYISKRNELFDINTMVIEQQQQGIEYHTDFSTAEANRSDVNNLTDINEKVVESSVNEELKRGGNSCGSVNNGIDIRSVDKVNFFETKYEIKSSKNNELKNQIEENVEIISNTKERSRKPRSKTTSTNRNSIVTVNQTPRTLMLNSRQKHRTNIQD